jgi:acyl carrier protein
MYKTGDLARYLPDGNIEFLGRIDQQVKVRGFRIELGEIEAALVQHPQVREAVVMLRGAGGEAKLVAYVLPVEVGQEAGVSELRRFLKGKLPEYMLPGEYVSVASWPRTPNGKVDRRALPEPDMARPELEQAYTPPCNPIQKTLADIWADVLERDRVGIHDNFFDLGGHSLLATSLNFRINQVFQIKIPMRFVFEKPTIAELALTIEEMLLNEIEGMDS